MGESLKLPKEFKTYLSSSNTKNLTQKTKNKFLKAYLD